MWETETTVPEINNVEPQMEVRAELRVPADLLVRKYPCTNPQTAW